MRANRIGNEIAWNEWSNVQMNFARRKNICSNFGMNSKWSSYREKQRWDDLQLFIYLLDLYEPKEITCWFKVVCLLFWFVKSKDNIALRFLIDIGDVCAFQYWKGLCSLVVNCMSFNVIVQHPQQTFSLCVLLDFLKEIPHGTLIISCAHEPPLNIVQITLMSKHCIFLLNWFSNITILWKTTITKC